MSEWTTEDVRLRILSSAWNMETAKERFDSWHKRHDAQVKAEALREAAPTAEQVEEALADRHCPVSGPNWQRNYKTGLLESTCVCGEVLSIKEEYEYIETSWARTRNLKHAGAALYAHSWEKRIAAVLALFGGAQ